MPSVQDTGAIYEPVSVIIMLFKPEYSAMRLSDFLIAGLLLESKTTCYLLHLLKFTNISVMACRM